MKNDSGGLLQYAVLYPCVDFQRLEDVAVITNYRIPVPVMPTQASENQQAQPVQPAGANK